jgi:hypothetical protein
MKSLLTVMGIGFAIVAIGATASAQNPPREIAGYRLGSNITVYGGRIASENAYAVRLRPYLKEAAVSVPQGFASGYVVYGVCDAPGIIVRIKVKYEDDGRAFFDRLLEALKKQYGEPSQYVGDPFQAYVAWKWSFNVSKNEKIAMILSHYDGDDEEHTQGNALKLSLTSQIAEESRCYEAQRRKEQTQDSKGKARLPADAEAWRRWLPAP